MYVSDLHGYKGYELDTYEFLGMSLVTLDLLIKDLFYDLIYRASNLLEQNFDVTHDKRLIRNMHMIYKLYRNMLYFIIWIELKYIGVIQKQKNIISFFSPIDALKTNKILSILPIIKYKNFNL